MGCGGRDKIKRLDFGTMGDARVLKLECHCILPRCAFEPLAQIVENDLLGFRRMQWIEA